MAKERLTQEQVNEILAKHNLWLETDGKQGVQADFSNKDVSNLNFSNSKLQVANFTKSNCRYANFTKSDCRYANFTESNCRYANFAGSNCSYAIFAKIDCVVANFTGSNCRDANFTGSNCKGAIFAESNCMGADFAKSDCNYAKFTGAQLINTIFFKVDLSLAILGEQQCPFPICPEEGSFIAFKKCKNNLIVKLEIPSDAKRISGTGRKCRADKAKVLEILKEDGKTPSKEKVAYSNYDHEFSYPLGEMVVEPNFCQKWNIECAEGIHFFMSKKEAIEY